MTKIEDKIELINSRLSEFIESFSKRLEDNKRSHEDNIGEVVGMIKNSSNKRPKTEKSNAKFVNSIINKTERLKNAREEIIRFNLENDCRSDPLTWEKSYSLKDGSTRKVVYSSVTDTSSLQSFASSGFSSPLITGNLARDVHVFLKDDKLTTLSRDFHGGVGIEYLWTLDENMKKPSGSWKVNLKAMTSKYDKDPRRGMIVPATGKEWEPSDDDMVPYWDEFGVLRYNKYKLDTVESCTDDCSSVDE